MLGGIFGTLSLMTMIVIGYDRYNVIVKGFTGVKITPGKVNTVAFITALECPPPYYNDFLRKCSGEYRINSQDFKIHRNINT
jgi:hypothetical protein